jgi:gamma-glutamylcyclotransferase (GGCT)/AIG2-like uncharacterized protein YtfP
MIRMFVNGQAMRGGTLHDALATAQFIGAATTAPRYRFFSVRDEFPALYPSTAQAHGIEGELYELEMSDLRDRLLPREPVELELTIIEMTDGTSSCAMRLRDGLADQFTDITSIGSWHRYLDTISRAPDV